VTDRPVIAEENWIRHVMNRSDQLLFTKDLEQLHYALNSCIL